MKTKNDNEGASEATQSNVRKSIAAYVKAVGAKLGGTEDKSSNESGGFKSEGFVVEDKRTSAGVEWGAGEKQGSKHKKLNSVEMKVMEAQLDPNWPVRFVKWVSASSAARAVVKLDCRALHHAEALATAAQKGANTANNIWNGMNGFSDAKAKKFVKNGVWRRLAVSNRLLPAPKNSTPARALGDYMKALVAIAIAEQKYTLVHSIMDAVKPFGTQSFTDDPTLVAAADLVSRKRMVAAFTGKYRHPSRNFTIAGNESATWPSLSLHQDKEANADSKVEPLMPMGPKPMKAKTEKSNKKTL